MRTQPYLEKLRRNDGDLVIPEMQVAQLMCVFKHAAGQRPQPTVAQVQFVQNVAQARPGNRAQPVLDRVEIQHYLMHLLADS